MLHHEAHKRAANEPPVTGGVIRNGGAELLKSNDSKLCRTRTKGQNQKKMISLHTKLQKVTDFSTLLKPNGL